MSEIGPNKERNDGNGDGNASCQKPRQCQDNAAAAKAYKDLTGQSSQITGQDLPSVIARVIEYLVYLGDTTYQRPIDDNDAIQDSLIELNKQAPIPGNPDPQIFNLMANDNHKSCLTSLDGILQGMFGKRPHFDGSTDETHYFVAYIKAMGSSRFSSKKP